MVTGWIIQSKVAAERFGAEGVNVEKGKQRQAEGLAVQSVDVRVRAVVKEYDPAGKIPVGRAGGGGVWFLGGRVSYGFLGSDRCEDILVSEPNGEAYSESDNQAEHQQCSEDEPVPTTALCDPLVLP